MTNEGIEALAGAIVNVIVTLAALAFAALRALFPLVASAVVLAVLAQRAAIDVICDRAAILIGLSGPPTGALRFGLTASLYGVVLGPAGALLVIGVMHLGSVLIGALAGTILGLVVAIAGLLPRGGDESTRLASLRFWQ